MFEITFLTAELVFAAGWILTRIILWFHRGSISWKREGVLLLMYVNLAVIIRFVLFPRALVDGHIQSLVFDVSALMPLRVNLVPLVYLFSYDNLRDILWNVAGNAAMFVPTGIVLPVVYRKLNTFGKVVLMGALLSLCIEILQLPFPSRASDIDDILLNTLGVAVGYGIYAGVRLLRRD